MLNFKTDDYECKSVKLITGEQIIMSKRRAIGRCHNKIHPGILTRKLFEKHECIGRNCVFFEKNECASYWKYLEQQQNISKKKRKEKEEKRAFEKSEAARIAQIQETLQQLMQHCGYCVQIIQVKQTNQGYVVFYVSKKAADEHCYQNFFHAANKVYSGISFTLKHIRDVDGHYVTIDEYKKRVKQ